MERKNIWRVASILAFGVFVVSQMATPALAANGCCAKNGCGGTHACFQLTEESWYMESCEAALTWGECKPGTYSQDCHMSGVGCAREYSGVEGCVTGPDGFCGDDASTGDRCN